MFRNKRLIGFFALTFVWSWACWLLALTVKSDKGYVEKALFFLGGFGPSISAVCFVGYTGGKAGLCAWLFRCICWHRSWGVGLLVFIAGGPLGEEFGWRGYALPAMQEHMSWQSASLLLGTVWGIWHLPLLFVTGSSQSNIQFMTFFVLIISSSVFYTWLYNRSRGSVLPVLALHTASNSWPGLISILPSDADQRPYYFVITLVVIAAIWLLFCNDLASPRNRR